MLKKMFIACVSLFVLSAFAFSTSAQEQVLKAGKKGEIHFRSSVRVGEVLLKPGMYQIQHAAEGENHVIVFKEVAMVAGYKMGVTSVGKEVARVNCKVEPTNKSLSNTKIYLRTNASGEKEIEKVQVAGEKVFHIF